MSTSAPPRLAMWLLGKFGGQYCAESLAGDLLETWRSRGNGWYWRQVAMAVLLNAWKIVRAHGLTFALAVCSVTFTIWLSRFGNWKVMAFAHQLQREVFDYLGPTPSALAVAKLVRSTTILAWFALLFVAQGYVVGRLHRHYAKTATLTAFTIFVFVPNLPQLHNLVLAVLRNPTGDWYRGLGLPGFMALNIGCMLIGAAWVARRWPRQRIVTA